MIWKSINHPDILPGYLISPEGYIKFKDIKDDDAITSPSYHSTNGYDFMLLNNKEIKLQLFPLDDIIAYAYIPIPSSLQSKRIKVSHINGDTRDISLDNLQWVEDIEEWRVCTYPGVKPDMYEVSSWGRVRNKKRNIIAKGSYDKYGYITYDMRFGEKQVTRKDDWKHIKAHRLIIWEFGTNIKSFGSNEVNHIDGVKTHNYPKNLESVSDEVNQKHSWKCGLKSNVRGEKSMLSTIKESDARKICEMLMLLNGNINETFNMLRNNISNITLKIVRHIASKESWKWVSDDYFSESLIGNKIFDKKGDPNDK